MRGGREGVEGGEADNERMIEREKMGNIEQESLYRG